jgi:hypothetical protein
MAEAHARAQVVAVIVGAAMGDQLGHAEDFRTLDWS